MQKRAYAAYLNAAVEVTGPEILLITEAARDLGIFVYLGTIERDVTVGRGTVFCTLVAIDPHAGVVGTHRKLMRPMRSGGVGHRRRQRATGAPGRRGAGRRAELLENWMPQARHALYAQGEELHVSVWPGNPRNTVDITRFIAREGRVFSLAANGPARAGDIPADSRSVPRWKKPESPNTAAVAPLWPHPTADGW